jgi:pimeloyl-ACP methyl ester carboxylesterase
MTGDRTRTGLFPSGMAYASWGSGTRTLISIPGGPGNEPPDPMVVRRMRRQMRALTDAGFTVWVVARRRGMPTGHSMADIADDYGALIRDEFGGRVDLVHGVSYGGAVVQYLAARQPEMTDRIVIHCAAHEVSEAFKDVDMRWAQAVHAGDGRRAAMAFSEYLLHGPRYDGARRIVAPLLAPMASPRGHEHFRQDILIEAEAECGYDSSDVLPDIGVPVLLVAGTDDLCFPRALVERTAAAIPDCTVVWYEGQGHLKACMSKRLGEDILAFASAGAGRSSG